jgi:hypothetical protein
MFALLAHLVGPFWRPRTAPGRHAHVHAPRPAAQSILVTADGVTYE